MHVVPSSAGDVLRSVPREMLLMLKTNDCLRSIDASLGTPVNTFLVTARMSSELVLRQDLATAPSIRCACTAPHTHLHPHLLTLVVTGLVMLPQGSLTAQGAALEAVSQAVRGAPCECLAKLLGTELTYLLGYYTITLNLKR